MATIKQIQYKLRQAKKKIIKINNDLTATKAKLKKFEAQRKKTKAATYVAISIGPKMKKAQAKKKAVSGGPKRPTGPRAR